MTNAADLEVLLEFFRIGKEDLEALASMREPLERHADQLVDEFYQHLLRFPATQELLLDHEVRDRLLESQRGYLLSLADPEIDERYLEERTRIGNTHERVGLDTRWYLGAYALYFDLLLPVAREAAGAEPEALERLISALQKRLSLDSEIAIRQYIERREIDLRGLNRDLEAAGIALSKEVDETTKDLRRTRERAQAAERLASVGTLVSGLAHEVGTPMGVIRGHAEALEGSVEGERAQWRLSMILEQIDRITGIIQSLLNIARPREFMQTRVDLHQTMDTALAFLTEKMRRRSVTVSSEARDVPAVSGDPEKMQQVFLNLLINGIDAMPEGGEMRVQFAHEDSDVVVRISDAGSGIPDDQIESIFDPFYTTKPAGRGNGLGLVVVKGIIEEHGGTIEARSDIGHGTEFEIRLPERSTGS